MKKLLFIFSFFAVNSLNCQVKLHSTEFIIPDTNILLIGCHNIFEIKGLAKFKSYEIHSKYHRVIDTLKNKKITIFTNYEFKDEIDTISIFQNDKLVFKKAFKVIPMPQLIPKIGEINDTIATVDEILLNPILHIGFLNTILFQNLNVEAKFSISIYNEENRLIYDTYCYSKIMNEELKLKIKDLKQNSYLKIEGHYGHAKTIKHKIYIE